MDCMLGRRGVRSGFDDIPDADNGPGDVRGVSLGRDSDCLVVDAGISVFGFDGSVIATMGQHVDQRTCSVKPP